MAVYSYIAKDIQGNRLSGIYRDIATVSALRGELAKVGYTLLKASKAKGNETSARPRTGRVSQKDLVPLAHQLAGMYSAGLSVLQCLQTLEDQADRPALKAILSDIRQSIETGSSLQKAFEPHKEVFSHFFVGMLGAGEAGGKLAQSLEMSAIYLEKRYELKQKIKSAFMYPMVVGVVCLIVVTSMLLFVVPMFSKLYARLHVPLPGPTQFLIFLSGLLRGGWIVIAAVVVCLVFGVKRLLRRPAVRTWVDDFKLWMPVFGKLNRMTVVARFTRTFATLVSVGVPLIEALEVAQAVADNARMSGIARNVQESVRTGNPIARSLEGSGLFPPMIIQMADSGEQGGILAEMLTKGADFLDRDIDRTISSLLVKLEPVLTLVMGLIIGLILLGVYLPMFDYMSHLK